MLFRDSNMIIFNFLESLLNISPRPSVVVDFPRPFIKILIGSNNPTGEIDSSATTKALASRVIDLLSLEMGLRYSFIPPVQGWLFESKSVAIGGDKVFSGFVVSTCFD